MSQPLSPAAQAVLDAVREICPAPANEIAAAALRAAANIMRQAYENEGYVDSPDDWLDNIAAELESDGPAVPDGSEPINQAPSNVAMQWCIPQSARMTFSCIAQECVKDNSDQPRYWSAVREAEASLIVASCEHARAVLARYGHQSPRPIPLSERQPTEADCDKEGRCWAWNQGNCFWWEIINSDLISFSHDAYTHWLPHWALPVPQEVEGGR